jgi:hypothetical protein
VGTQATIANCYYCNHFVEICIKKLPAGNKHGGRMFMESVAGSPWNQWPDAPEYAQLSVQIKNARLFLMMFYIEAIAGLTSCFWLLPWPNTGPAFRPRRNRTRKHSSGFILAPSPHLSTTTSLSSAG